MIWFPGMGDALSEHLVSGTTSSAPFVIRYVPYGALSEVRISCFPFGLYTVNTRFFSGDAVPGAPRNREQGCFG
jgi:hypothetical protein